MRPRGEVRQVLAETLERLVLERGAVSARELAEVAQVGFERARRTLDEMASSRQVIVTGHGKEPGTRWHNLYEPAPRQDIGDTPQPWGGIEALMHVWVAPAPEPD